MNDTSTSGGDASVVDTATDRASDVADTAKDQATQVAGSVKEQAGTVAQEVSRQTQNLVGEAKGTLHDQARTRTGEVGEALHRWSDQTRALAEGRRDEAGEIGRYARQAGDKLAEFAQRVDERGFDGLVQDVQRFARQKPGVFLLGAGAAGFLVGRLLRGAAASDSDSDSDSGSGSPSDTRSPGMSPRVDPAALKPPIEPTLARTGPVIPPPPLPSGGSR